MAVFLTMYSEEKYLEMGTELFLSQDMKSGFGINPDGYLLSVFSLTKGRGEELVEVISASSAKKLDCMGQYLVDMYSLIGFKVTLELPWNEKYAPKNWNMSKFGKMPYFEMERV